MSPDAAGPASDPTTHILQTAHEAFVSMDAGGFITDWNLQAETTFGWSREEAVGRVLSDTIIPHRYREQHLRGLEHFLETGDGPVLSRRFEIEAVHRNGHELPIELTITPLPVGDSHTFHAFLHDISERRRHEQFLAAQHATTTVLAEAETVKGAIPLLLAALGEKMGWEFGAYWFPSEVSALHCEETWTARGLDLTPFERVTREIGPVSGAGLPGRVWAAEKPVFIPDVTTEANFLRTLPAAEVGLTAAMGLPLFQGGEVRGVMEYYTRAPRHPEPELMDMMEALTTQIGRFLTILAERSHLVDRLHRLSLTDELTNLPNRRAWNEGLERELARARRGGEQVCVAMLDLDSFKAFNDEYGHMEGDALLRDAARAWRDLLRATDLLARYGGEEFALAFPALPLERALTVVDRVRAATPGGLTCSAGLVSWNEGESPEQLINRADGALYDAKRGGRDRTVVAEW